MSAAERSENDGDFWRLCRTRRDVFQAMTDHPMFAAGYWLALEGHPFDPDIHSQFEQTRGRAGDALEVAQKRYEEGRLLACFVQADRLAATPELHWPLGRARPPEALVAYHCILMGIEP